MRLSKFTGVLDGFVLQKVCTTGVYDMPQSYDIIEQSVVDYFIHIKSAQKQDTRYQTCQKPCR
jgi:hypothetical protein